jgi:cell division protein FtsW (lipid II flippase)
LNAPYYHIDWALLIAIVALCALGVMMIYSTSANPTRVTSRLYITPASTPSALVFALLFTLHPRLSDVHRQVTL